MVSNAGEISFHVNTFIKAEMNDNLVILLVVIVIENLYKV